MKTLIKISFLLLAFFSLISCQDKIEDTYKVNAPVYMSYNDLREAFTVTGGEEIIQPGKIYFKDNFIFVNEYQKGIHVIDNSDPSNPVVIKFLEIPGNVDMAIKGNILYADSYVDLLSIDISDIDNIVEVDRDTNVFPYIIPLVEDGVVEPVDENQGVITGYNVTEKTEKVDDNSQSYPQFPRWNDDLIFFASSAETSEPVSGDNGVGGSMARFTLKDDYLYIVDNYSLNLFNISEKENPEYEKSINVGWNIETIFPYENKLFIGSQTGMYVYNIQNTANPEYISEFRHASACDPVVVEGDYAYVTLRAGNLCGAINSQLDIIDISDIADPVLLKTYPMQEPYGLGIDNNVLFVCDGNAGLKIYDATDKLQVDDHQLAVYPAFQAFDVIPLGDVLIMISADGLYQYDYSNLEEITQLSFIPIYGN
jgi:hypothetical protein